MQKSMQKTSNLRPQLTFTDKTNHRFVILRTRELQVGICMGQVRVGWIGGSGEFWEF